MAVDTDLLREVLCPFPIRLAVLFGSHATDTARWFSDLDIAIEFEASIPDTRRRKLLDEITGALVQKTGREAIDLIDISTASPDVGYSILHDGELLFGDESEAAELESEFLQRKLDFASVKPNSRTPLASGSERERMVDPDRVKTKLGHLEGYIKGLVAKQNCSREEYLRDRNRQDIVE